MPDLNAPGVAKAIADNLLADIDEYSKAAYNDGHRNHLGASLIGRKCWRQLQFTFRWIKAEDFSGRILRLFQRGHHEEDAFVERLRGIGCQVWEKDEHGNQFRISDCNGHFGGSLDGVVKLPPKYGIESPLLAEFKTNGTGSGFTKLCKEGMMLAKPEHFAQTCTYGLKMGFEHVLYENVNKNDDDLHIEIVRLNHNTGRQMIEKAEKIINATELLPRVSDNPTNFNCSFCDFKEICHFGADHEKNCRSCKFAKPVENAQWECGVHKAIIPKDFIKQGCGEWQSFVKSKL